jgi:hypothetical protein
MSLSPYRERFILKGGLLLAALDARRPTRDGDLLAAMDNDEALIAGCVKEIASIEVDDGIAFAIDTVQVTTIREEDQYAGLRLNMVAMIGQAKAKLALDINFGDPVTPGAVRIPYPAVLGESTFETLAYPIETILAEKIVTGVARGETNTRERDWADIWRLIGSHDLDAEPLAEAIKATAAYRGVGLAAMSDRLGQLVERRGGAYRTWRQRQGPDATQYPDELSSVVSGVTDFADPVLTDAVHGRRWVSRARLWTAR